MSPCFCLEILENTALSLVFVFKKKDCLLTQVTGKDTGELTEGEVV